MKKLIFIIPFCLLFASCDIFSTRPPEDPDTPRSSVIPATTPEILIQNLKDSFKDKISSNYLQCFVDSSFSSRKFVFSPSAGASLKYQSLDNWGLQEEEHYFRNLCNSVGGDNFQIILNFYDDEENFQGDSSSFSAQYTISVPTEDEQKPKYYQGNLQFTLIRDDRSQWVIAFWRDIMDEKFPSWSELKGRYY